MKANISIARVAQYLRDIGLTEFKIYLPSYGGDEDKSAASFPPIEVAGGSETILIVEDEVSLRDVIRQSLSSKSYHVLAAENGAAAKRLCEA
jgi:two-component system, cell cycle sensor histidine kinase and response regulator CckA